MAFASIQAYNALVLADLSVGDLIEFPRGAYSHWAVYIALSEPESEESGFSLGHAFGVGVLIIYGIGISIIFYLAVFTEPPTAEKSHDVEK